MPPLHPLSPCHRHLMPPLPFNAFPSPFNTSAVSSMPLLCPLMHLHWHLTSFIRLLTPPCRPLTSFCRPITYLHCYLTLPCCPLTLTLRSHFSVPSLPPDAYLLSFVVSSLPFKTSSLSLTPHHLLCPITLFHCSIKKCLRPTFNTSGHTLRSLLHPLTPAFFPLAYPHCPSTPPNGSLTPHHCRLTLFSLPLAPCLSPFITLSLPFNASPPSVNASLLPFNASPLT